MGMITSSATGTSTKAWEFVKNYYTTNAFHPKNVVVVNERAFQHLEKRYFEPGDLGFGNIETPYGRLGVLVTDCSGGARKNSRLAPSRDSIRIAMRPAPGEMMEASSRGSRRPPTRGRRSTSFGNVS